MGKTETGTEALCESAVVKERFTPYSASSEASAPTRIESGQSGVRGRQSGNRALSRQEARNSTAGGRARRVPLKSLKLCSRVAASELAADVDSLAFDGAGSSSPRNSNAALSKWPPLRASLSRRALCSAANRAASSSLSWRRLYPEKTISIKELQPRPFPFQNRQLLPERGILQCELLVAEEDEHEKSECPENRLKHDATLCLQRRRKSISLLPLQVLAKDTLSTVREGTMRIQNAQFQSYSRTDILSIDRVRLSDETFAGVFKKNADRVLIFYLEDAV